MFLCFQLTQNIHFNWNMDNFKFNFLPPGQNITMLWGVSVTLFLPSLLKCSAEVLLSPSQRIATSQCTYPNNTQHVATRRTGWPNARNMLHPTRLRYVALKCCHRLARALNYFLRGFIVYKYFFTSTCKPYMLYIGLIVCHPRGCGFWDVFSHP